MKFTLTALTAALAITTTSAAPTEEKSHPFPCGLNYDTASAIVNGFGTLLTAFDAKVATALLAAEGFSDTSSSINFLSNQPLNGPTFPSREAFIAGQGTQPPIGFEVLGIDAITCSGKDAGVIAFRWLASVGQNQTGGAKGINILYVREDGSEGMGVDGADGWVIDTVFSEFNSAVWVKEFGGTCAVPSRPSMLFRA